MATDNRRDRSLCANCDHWREEHYDAQGAWIGERIGCAEYDGVNPGPDRMKKKEKETAYLYEEIADVPDA